MSLGQERVDVKENEIVPIPKLLKLIIIKDCTVTIDAMGFQTEIADEVRTQKANYILTLRKKKLDLSFIFPKLLIS